MVESRLAVSAGRISKVSPMKGFTLVELIIVLVVVAILAVGAAPLFIGSGGTESLVLRERTLSILRNTQLNAMQNTPLTCTAVVLQTNALGRATTTHCGSSASSFVTNADSFNQITDFQGITLTITNSAGVTAGPPNELEFDSLGRPRDASGLVCSGAQPCRLTFTETRGASQSVCINREGYIYGC
ncbi:Type II secretory pathway component [Idiomarina fontislapidosi]|uniref:Type II secretory pathway component n=2 Tax=Idiomarina fontislapidosi TaxID=263723 RepID=A0A432Y2K7_9GAMM|nr:Type II secretory pathway component [Idiomarina fontislapidosi]